VTEMITGFDLVEWQLRVAAGEPLPLAQDQIAMRGHAVEARLYAEDPAKGFLPSIGRLERFQLPAGIRVDAGVEAGGEITPYYDPMIAKLIAHAPDRVGALRALAGACAAVEVWPVRTNAGFLARLLAEPDVVDGGVDTGFIETRLDRLATPPPPSQAALAAAARQLAPTSASPWGQPSLAGFRMAEPAATARLQWQSELLEAPFAGPPRPAFGAAQDTVVVFEGGEPFVITRPVAAGGAGAASSDGAVTAPMPGRIVQLSVKPGDRVERGRTLLVLEAMKMEHALAAPIDGVVAEVRVAQGDQVSEGALLIKLGPPA